MISANETVLNNLNAPVRRIKARAELYNGSALAATYTQADRIKSLQIDRVGEDSKFFGFGVCQKLNLKLIDKDRELSFSTAECFNISFDEMQLFPLFHITEVHRDETTNELSITAYDALEGAAARYTSEITLEAPYTLGEYATACGALLGLEMVLPAFEMFNYTYSTGANLEGSETIREALNAIAEATQTIYFVNSANKLEFKRLEKDSAAAFEIDKEKCIELSSKTNRRLGAICYATELGDNVIASTTEAGTTQYVRNNPFLTLEDIEPLLNDAIAAIGGLTINQFTCSWRGNYLVEIGDKLALTTKDNEKVNSFLLIDTLYYDGSFSQDTEWSFTDNEAETASNPVTIGEALKQTYAKVNKAAKEIEMLVSETSNNTNKLSSLQMTTSEINASVKAVEEKTEVAVNGISQEMQQLTKEVSAKLDSEQVKIEIQSELAKGASKVVTSTGFVFDDAGLTVSKSGSEMKTQITEDGMQVFRENEAVLTANNVGVNAVNLHATTYLIIGTNSRLEDYGENRTACFYIGG
jgi:hypothetical protein